MGAALPSPCLPSTLQLSHRRKSTDFSIRQQLAPTKNRTLCLRGVGGCGGMRQLMPAICSTQCPVDSADGALRVFLLSDYAENTWVKSLSSDKFLNYVLIVAGDVAETFGNFVTTMSLLRERFRRVFYVLRNHDLWLRREGTKYHDSLEKLNAILDSCRKLDIETTPAVVNDLGIIPIFSWYHESFDKEKDITDFWIPSLGTVCKDFHACRWPMELSSKDLSLAFRFDEREESIHSYGNSDGDCPR